MKLTSPNSIIYLGAHLVLFLVGTLLRGSDDVFYSNLGVSLIAAAITGWVIYVYLRFAESTRRRLETLTDLGILRGFQRRGAAIKEEYDFLLADAKKEIDIMGFGLRALREDYIDDFHKWKSRAAVRILLLDPHSPNPDCSYAQQRDVEEGNPAGTIGKDVEKFLEEVQSILDDRFSVRLYQCLPSINIFRVDGRLFWGPYFISTQSRNTPTFLVRKPGLLFDPISSQFDEIWENHSLDANAWLAKKQQ